MDHESECSIYNRFHDYRCAVDGADMITYTKKLGGKRLSLAFAAFPEIFDNNDGSLIESIYYIP